MIIVVAGRLPPRRLHGATGLRCCSSARPAAVAGTVSGPWPFRLVLIPARWDSLPAATAFIPHSYLVHVEGRGYRVPRHPHRNRGLCEPRGRWGQQKAETRRTGEAEQFWIFDCLRGGSSIGFWSGEGGQRREVAARSGDGSDCLIVANGALQVYPSYRHFIASLILRITRCLSALLVELSV